MRDNLMSITDFNSYTNREDIILYDAYKEFANGWTKELNTQKESILWTKIKELTNCNSLRYYLFALHYYKTEYNLDQTLLYVEKAVERFNQKIPEFINDETTSYGIINYEYNHIIDIKSKVYQLAGEVYAIKGNLTASENYYKKYQYIHTLLKSDFEDKNNISLYSYRSITNYSLRDLANRTITVCHPCTMNDPFDSPIMLWRSEKNLELVCTEKKHIKPFCKSFDYFRIRCFTECNPKQTLMWSHYADGHKGFCIKYRLSMHFIKEGENSDNKHMYLKKVEYVHGNIDIKVDSMNSNLGYATKHKVWKRENEVRLISYNPMINGYFESIELDELSDIEAIYFGVRCTKEDIETIKCICNARYKNVKYYKMDTKDSNIYSLKPKRI